LGVGLVEIKVASIDRSAKILDLDRIYRLTDGYLSPHYRPRARYGRNRTIS
jgi:hypothetical protein